MSQAKPGDKVRVHYTGKLKDGSQFDSSGEDEPLEFVIGSGHIIPGFEKAVIGMEPGESKSVTVPANQAYGKRQPEMVVEVNRQQIPKNIKPEVGRRLQIQRTDGRSLQAVVARVSDNTVTLDTNHPLSGKDLVFDLELVGIE